MEFILWVVVIVFSLVIVGFTATILSTADKEISKSHILWLVVIACALLIAGWSWFISWKNNPDRIEAERNKPCLDTVSAYIVSKRFVQRELKSPGSADFPFLNGRTVISESIGECRFAVKGYVDSQNGFGSMIRSNYAIIIRLNLDTQEWTNEAIKIE